jgi:hypothetical protein
VYVNVRGAVGVLLIHVGVEFLDELGHFGGRRRIRKFDRPPWLVAAEVCGADENVVDIVAEGVDGLEARRAELSSLLQPAAKVTTVPKEITPIAKLVAMRRTSPTYLYPGRGSRVSLISHTGQGGQFRLDGGCYAEAQAEAISGTRRFAAIRFVARRPYGA